MPVGFIVEGHMEADIIKGLCRKAEVRRLRMNGCDVPVKKVAEIIAPQLRLLQRKTSEIVIILDREQRETSSADLEIAIRRELNRMEIDCGRITITCPDRNFESWIAPYVGDDCSIRSSPIETCEGYNGKAVLKQKFKQSGRTYVQTVDGVKLFKMLDPQALSLNSNSFSRFLESFSGECWWLEGRASRLDI